VLLGDHIPLPLERPTAITEAARLYDQVHAPVYGVHRVPAGKVEQYGILQGAPTETPRVYRLLQLHEKPTQAYAQQHLRTEGLGANEFFAHNGVYAFPPALWETLAHIAAHYSPNGGEWTLTSAQQRLLEQMPAYMIESTHSGLDFGTAEEYRRAFGCLAGFGDV